MFKLSEGTVAVGSLILFAFWLFVCLPLLYLPLRIEFQQHSSAAPLDYTSFATMLPTFLGGSVAAFLIGWIFNWWTRPIISAQLVPGTGCYITTSRGNPPTHDARFLRLIIRNTGRSSIKECSAYVTGITRIVGGNRLPVQKEVLELMWSHAGASARNLPRGAFFYLDIACLDVPHNGPSYLTLCVSRMPNHFAGLFLSAATFEVEIKIAADNASPVDREVRFDFDPLLRDLTFQLD